MAIFAATVVTTRYVSLGSVVSAAALPILALLLARVGWSAPVPASSLAFACGCAGLVLLRHSDNLKRLAAGTERRLGAGRG